MILIRLDAVMNSTIDSYKPSNRETYETPVITVSNFEGMDASFHTLGFRRHKKLSLKGGRITWNLARRYQSLLPLAANKFLRLAYNAFCKVLANCEDEKHDEIGVLKESTEKKRLNNDNGFHTIALRYPDTCHYYISNVFCCIQNFNSSSVGHVMD